MEVPSFETLSDGIPHDVHPNSIDERVDAGRERSNEECDIPYRRLHRDPCERRDVDGHDQVEYVVGRPACAEHHRYDDHRLDESHFVLVVLVLDRSVCFTLPVEESSAGLHRHQDAPVAENENQHWQRVINGEQEDAEDEPADLLRPVGRSIADPVFVADSDHYHGYADRDSGSPGHRHCRIRHPVPVIILME